MHSLRDAAHVVDIRTVGLTAAVELAPRSNQPGRRGAEVVDRAFWHHDTLLRQASDTIVATPPLIISEQQTDQLVGILRNAIESVD